MRFCVVYMHSQGFWSRKQQILRLINVTRRARAVYNFGHDTNVISGRVKFYTERGLDWNLYESISAG